MISINAIYLAIAALLIFIAMRYRKNLLFFFAEVLKGYSKIDSYTADKIERAVERRRA